MIDMVAISVPFLRKHVTTSPAGPSFIDDRTLLETFGVDLTGDIAWDGEGYKYTRLRHNFESLASSHASLAFKIINGTDFRQEPYVRIVGNPAKLLQGHNVFGPDSLELCCSAIWHAFAYADLPFLYFLDWHHATVDYLDLTYSAKCENQHQAQQIIDMMRNVSVGQTKPWYDQKYKTTVYWNRNSEVRRLKAYLKLPELDNQVKELSKKLIATKLPHYQRQLEEINSPVVREFADGCIRFEARVYHTWLTGQGLDIALGKITDPQIQEKEPDIIPRLWRKAFQDVFKAFEGAKMQANDENKVLDALKIAFGRITPKGNVTYAKAQRLFNVYRNIVTDGYIRAKENSDRKTWHRHMKDLNYVGLTVAHLQNFTGELSNVVPFVRMINVDFSAQFPAGYVEPLPLSVQYNKNPALLRLVS